MQNVKPARGPAMLMCYVQALMEMKLMQS